MTNRPAPRATRTTHVFVDFENIRDVELNLISGKPVVFKL